MFEDTSEHPIDRAEDVLIDTALRFDAYQYMDDTGFDAQLEYEKIRAGDPTDWDDLQKMAMFFCLQRSLCKGPLVYEPFNGKNWRIFREMFFEVIALEVPECYRLLGRYNRWSERYEHRLDEAIACVRQEHDLIEYEEDV